MHKIKRQSSNKRYGPEIARVVFHPWNSRTDSVSPMQFVGRGCHPSSRVLITILRISLQSSMLERCLPSSSRPNSFNIDNTLYQDGRRNILVARLCTVEKC